MGLDWKLVFEIVIGIVVAKGICYFISCVWEERDPW